MAKEFSLQSLTTNQESMRANIVDVSAIAGSLNRAIGNYKEAEQKGLRNAKDREVFNAKSRYSEALKNSKNNPRGS